MEPTVLTVSTGNPIALLTALGALLTARFHLRQVWHGTELYWAEFTTEEGMTPDEIEQVAGRLRDQARRLTGLAAPAESTTSENP